MQLEGLVVDTKMETEGVWIRPEEDSDAEFLIARSGNPAHKAAVFALLNRVKVQAMTHERKAGPPVDDEAVGIESRSLWLEHCLLGWRNIYRIDGKVDTYSKERAATLFADPGLAPLFELLKEESQSLENFRVRSVSKAVGKSEPSSAS